MCGTNTREIHQCRKGASGGHFEHSPAVAVAIEAACLSISGCAVEVAIDTLYQRGLWIIRDDNVARKGDQCGKRPLRGHSEDRSSSTIGAASCSSAIEV